jgi:uncharacterized protein (DUF2252 family)
MTAAPIRSELESLGRGLRTDVPRRSQGVFEPLDRDPLDILESQGSTRIPELVPIRYGRMMQTPFAFFRGCAALMAADLARGPITGPGVVSCGDAHVSNFGLFASPERRVLFDLTDFDEAGMGPWEWDLKRLAASVVVAGRDNGSGPDTVRDTARATVAGYRERLRQMVDLSVLERFYVHVDADSVLAAAKKKKDRKLVQRTVDQARRRTSDRTLDRLAVREDGGATTIIDQPPLTRRVAQVDREALEVLFEQYRGTVRADAAQVLSQFRLADFVLRVVGVGSVGTRCFVALLLGPDDEPLFLQIKEANRSVLETYGGVTSILPDGLNKALAGHQGYRVVACQRVLQAQSDPFLGWISVEEEGPEGPTTTDYYWRQFRDMKGSVDVSSLSPSQLESYARLCAVLLARAHAQSPHGLTAAAYMGRSGVFDEAIADWAVGYADQVERDHEALVKAARSGRIVVHEDA